MALTTIMIEILAGITALVVLAVVLTETGSGEKVINAKVLTFIVSVLIVGGALFWLLK